MVSSIWSKLTRVKIEEDNICETKLSRVLNLFDLTALSVGSTLGLGIYVLAGQVAYDSAGPAVVISLFIAALSSAFAGLCYAELGGRVPKAGSAYAYSYVTIGEFGAFTIGWNLILGYAICTSSVASGLSIFVNKSILNETMSTALRQWMPMNASYLSAYPDILAFVVVAVFCALLAFGVKESSWLNNILTTVNLATILTIIVAGAMKADFRNWTRSPSEVTRGDGGFMPFGISGVMIGAAKCFFGFTGFDGIATTGEETPNPKRNIPLAIVISLIIIYLAYFGTAAVLTLMIPYYKLDRDAPFLVGFEQLEMPAIKWIVTVGALFALCTSLLGALFPLPRILYSMGNDGILFKVFRNVNSMTKTPVFATIISGLFAAIMALLFNLDALIELMSLGTLVSYSIVSINVLILRYRAAETAPIADTSASGMLRQLYNGNGYCEANKQTSNISKISMAGFCMLTIAWCLFERHYTFQTTAGAAICGIIGLLLILICLVISVQPTEKAIRSFRVPLVPLIPCLSIFVNLYLMLQFQESTWWLFVIWIIIGYAIYFFYGLGHSEQVAKDEFDFANDNPKTKHSITLTNAH